MDLFNKILGITLKLELSFPIHPNRNVDTKNILSHMHISKLRNFLLKADWPVESIHLTLDDRTMVTAKIEFKNLDPKVFNHPENRSKFRQGLKTYFEKFHKSDDVQVDFQSITMKQTYPAEQVQQRTVPHFAFSGQIFYFNEPKTRKSRSSTYKNVSKSKSRTKRHKGDLEPNQYSEPYVDPDWDLSDWGEHLVRPARTSSSPKKKLTKKRPERK